MSETQIQTKRCPKCGGAVIETSSRDPYVEWEFCENDDCDYDSRPPVQEAKP